MVARGKTQVIARFKKYLDELQTAVVLHVVLLNSVVHTPDSSAPYLLVNT